MELEETQEWDDSDPIHSSGASSEDYKHPENPYPELQTESLNACVAKAVVDVSICLEFPQKHGGLELCGALHTR
jgi:hypothetical protein